jgi:hypothetical protein
MKKKENNIPLSSVINESNTFLIPNEKSKYATLNETINRKIGFLLLTDLNANQICYFCIDTEVSDKSIHELSCWSELNRIL